MIAPNGVLRKGYLPSQINSTTRFVPHGYVAPSEGSVAQELIERWHRTFREELPKGTPLPIDEINALYCQCSSGSRSVVPCLRR